MSEGGKEAIRCDEAVVSAAEVKFAEKLTFYLILNLGDQVKPKTQAAHLIDSLDFGYF